VIAAPPEPVRRIRRELPAQRERSPWPYRRRLWIAAGLAFAVHATVYFSGRHPLETAVEFGMEDPAPSVDVELVEQAAPESAAAAAEPPPVPQPPMPEPPKPDPVPEPPKPDPVPEPPKPDDMAPPKPKPTPKPLPKPAPAKPRAVSNNAAQASPGATAATASSGLPGATGAKSGGRTGGPGHLYNPKPAYPPESRAAGEQGAVILRVMVEASGRPGSVSLARSSGFPRLDRAALEAVRRWRFKPATRDGQAFAATVDVPVRFSLR